jgi:hypothetical protein
MASGDAQRVWFPEMLDELERKWSSASVSWEELADFCQVLTQKRKGIRESRGIELPLTRCPRCGAISRSDVSGVSIRSALFALKKSGAVTEAEHEALDKSWRRFKTRNRLDAYGRKADSTQNTDGEGSDSWR